MRRSVLALGSTLALGFVLTQMPSSLAQQRWEPPDPTNLQVLPKDIAKRDLVQTMRSFAQSLDVRCEHCHVGEEGQSLDTFDFASDAKPEKATARKMIRMVGDLNTQYLQDVGHEHGDGAPKVTCYTCHRGETHPQTRPPGN